MSAYFERMMTRVVSTANRARLQLRIWNNIELDPSGCWLWRGRKNKGYGTMNIRLPSAGHRVLYVHRVAYEAFRRTIPEGKVVAHSIRCVSPACCNPWHLRATSQSTNMRDIARAHRWRETNVPERAIGAPLYRKAA